MVDQSTSTYPFKCYLETLLSYNADAKNTHLETSFFYNPREPLNIGKLVHVGVLGSNPGEAEL